MFHEEIEKWTKSELLGHLKTMLVEEQASHEDNIRLTMPFTFDTSSVVGGLSSVTRDTLPQYAVDVSEKLAEENAGDMNTHVYSGAITVLVGSPSPNFADAQIKRHARVVEMWINQHLYPFPRGGDITTDYWIMEMRFSSCVFSGAMPLEQTSQEDETGYWVAGCEINIAWRVQEPSPGNLVHA